MIVAGALLVGGTASAQTKADGTTGASVQKENVEKKNKGDKSFKGNKIQKGNRGPKFNPFDGVQLTQDQQQRLQVLREGLGPVQLTPEQQAKIPENKNLTDAQKKQLKEERKAQKLEAKKNYLGGVKEILTPEQYVIFLENCYLYAPQDQNKVAKTGKQGDFKKGHKDGKDKKDKRGKKSEK